MQVNKSVAIRRFYNKMKYHNKEIKQFLYKTFHFTDIFNNFAPIIFLFIES